MIYRLTSKLAKKLKRYPSNTAPDENNPFIDWASTLFRVEGYQYILVTNRQSLLSWVFYGKGINDSNTYIRAANQAIRDCLHHHNFEFIYESHVAPHMGIIRFSKIGDRSVNGVMVDLIKHAEIHTIQDDLAPCEIGPILNGIPQCKRKNIWPIDAFGEMQVTPLADTKAQRSPVAKHVDILPKFDMFPQPVDSIDMNTNCSRILRGYI